MGSYRRSGGGTQQWEDLFREDAGEDPMYSNPELTREPNKCLSMERQNQML